MLEIFCWCVNKLGNICWPANEVVWFETDFPSSPHFLQFVGKLVVSLLNPQFYSEIFSYFNEYISFLPLKTCTVEKKDLRVYVWTKCKCGIPLSSRSKHRPCFVSNLQFVIKIVSYSSLNSSWWCGIALDDGLLPIALSFIYLDEIETLFWKRGEAADKGFRVMERNNRKSTRFRDRSVLQNLRRKRISGGSTHRIVSLSSHRSERYPGSLLVRPWEILRSLFAPFAWICVHWLEQCLWSVVLVPATKKKVKSVEVKLGI